MSDRKDKTTFGRFAWPLRRAGFRKTWDSRAGGARMVEYRRDDPDGRTLICQLWDDGRHRISHNWLGCSKTVPSGFTTEDELTLAVEREATRTDSHYRDPDNHHAPGAREFLLARQAAVAAAGAQCR